AAGERSARSCGGGRQRTDSARVRRRAHPRAGPSDAVRRQCASRDGTAPKGGGRCKASTLQSTDSEARNPRIWQKSPTPAKYLLTANWLACIGGRLYTVAFFAPPLFKVRFNPCSKVCVASFPTTCRSTSARPTP